MASADALLKGLAAVVCLAVGLVALSGRRRGPGRALATFLLLIAVNQGAEAVRASVVDPAARVLAFRVASIAASADPLVLAWAVRSTTGDARRGPAFAATFVASAALALYAGWILVPGDSGFYLALATFTAIVYVALLFRAARATIEGATPGTPWLLGALAVVAGPAAQRVYDPIGEILFTRLAGAPIASNYVIVLLPALLTLALVLALLLARMRGAPAGVRRGVAAAAASAVALTLIARLSLFVLVVAPGGHPLATALEVVGRAEASLRWLAFGALASAALLRANELDFTLSRRRRAARVVLALSFAVALGIVLALPTTLLGRAIAPVEVVALALLALVSQGARRLVDATAMRLYGIPPPGDPIAALDAYRRAVLEVVARGSAPSRDAALQHAREELGIDLAAAAVIERAAEEASPAPLRPGQLLAGRYHIDRVLGRGGAGRAFLADDLRIQRRVVVKEVFVDAPSEEVLREARLAGALQHPRVATVYDVLVRRDSVLLVQEYVPGGSLADLLAHAARGPEHAPLFARIVEGAAAVHAAGIAHGDLKPENVLLTDAGEPKLADFGVADRAPDDTVAAERVLGGTPAYLAPERLRGGPATKASDVWALGVLGRRLLGDAPGAAWDGVLARAMATDPEARYADAGEMLAALPQLQ